MKILRIFIAAASLALSSSNVVAQHRHGHAHNHGQGEIGPNGGPMEYVSSTHIEIIARDSSIKVYLYDADLKPITAHGAEATVTIQADGKRETVKLEVSSANLLEGRTSLVVSRGARAVISIKMPGKSVIQVRHAM